MSKDVVWGFTGRAPEEKRTISRDGAGGWQQPDLGPCDFLKTLAEARLSTWKIPRNTGLASFSYVHDRLPPSKIPVVYVKSVSLVSSTPFSL